MGVDTGFSSCVVFPVTVSDEVPASACAGKSAITGVPGAVVASVSGLADLVFSPIVWLCEPVPGTFTAVTGSDCECAPDGFSETGGSGGVADILVSVVSVDGGTRVSGTGSTVLGAAGMDTTGAVDVGALL